MFTCALIGESTLLVRCGDALLERGHAILGVWTRDAQVATWAAGLGLPVHPVDGDLVAGIGATSPDYLFSIVNDRVLAPDVLAIPRRRAINYHDGPLPRYAGMHVTSWAIMQGEREHGITWHTMAATVDAGEILKQTMFPVAEDETALSLNAKCYEAASAAFIELVDELDRGAESPRPQDTAGRTYFGRYRRPPAAGVLSWNRPASQIAAQVRALEVGPYPGPLGRPRFAVGGEFLVCAEVAVLDGASPAAPGTVLSIDRDGIAVATRDRPVLVRRLLTIEGEPLAPEDAATRFGLRAGDRLDEVTAERLARAGTLDAAAARHEAFWTRRLQELEAPRLPFLELSDRGDEARGEWDTIGLALPEDFAARMADVHESGFPADGVLAAFATYLARTSAQAAFDIAVATPSLTRSVREVDALFASQVPCRIEIDREAGFAEVFASVGAAMAAAREHAPIGRDIGQRYPELRRLGIRGAGPLPIGAAIVDDAGTEAGAGAPVPRDGVRLRLVVQRDASRCRLDYDRRALSDADAQRMAGHLTTLFDAIAGDPRCAVGRLPLLGDEERERVLVEWNRTDASYRRDATVHGLIREQAARTPDAVALRLGDRAVTYATLIADAERLAGRLRALGVGADTLVGLAAERTPEMVTGLLGVLLAGGAYVPIDPSYPAERVRFVLQDAGVRVLLTQRSVADRLPAHEAAVVLLDEPAPGLAVPDERGGAATPAEATARSLAYVIYTSGSTGRPKGVMVEHRGVVNYLTWCIEAYGLAEGLGAPVHSPTAFDLTVTSLLAPLVAGRTVVLAPDSSGAEALAGALRAQRDFTLVKLTPSHLDLLRHQLPADEAAGRTRCFVVGGEALHGSSLAFWMQHAPGTRIINEYGPTETVVGCCVHEATANDVHAPVVPIGRPIANTRLYVLDAGMQPLPVGVPGELYIAGDGVARGYLNRPELTAERFVPDPFAALADARMYRTGDRVRWRDDGRLEFLGRFDDQVKLRGYRIEPGEVEAMLSSHASVGEAAVIVHAAAEGDARLVAYHAPPRGTASASEDELRAFLEARLPSYMVPSVLVPLDALPLTANGKVDRARLPAPRAARAVATTAVPRTPTERALAGIWADVLGLPVDAIGLTSDFFDLGGHSLLAVRMISRVEQALGKRLPLATMLTNPTIAHLSQALAGPSIDVESPIVQIQRGEPGVAPLFYFHGAFGGGGFYCHQMVRALDPAQPVYLVAPHQPGGPETIEGMAESILPLIRTAWPSGPYHLGGMCNGGLLAFEVARRLRASGEPVGVLAIVNASDRSAGIHAVRKSVAGVARAAGLARSRELDVYLRVRKPAMRVARLVRRAETVAGPPGPAAWRPLRLAAGVARLLAQKLASRLRSAGPSSGHEGDVRPPLSVPEGWGEADFELDTRRWRYMSRATESYAPGPYDGKATVVFWERSDALADSDGLHEGDETRGWRRVARDVEVLAIPGGNKDVYTRDAGALGRVLAALLRAAEGATRRAGHGRDEETTDGPRRQRA